MAEQTPTAPIRVEVAYATPERQWLRSLTLAFGATVADALAASGIADDAGIDLTTLDVGIWSRPALLDAVLADGDRVEWYRPLIVNPKEARRRRARG